MTQSFDERAATWDEDPAKLARARAVAAAIAAEVPLDPSMRALEFGAGTGLVTFALEPRLVQTTLADVSEGMLDMARRKIDATGEHAMQAVKLDLVAEPWQGEPFDLIHSTMTLHHVPDTATILQRFREALARPGYLCIADLDTEDGSFHGPDFDGHLGFDRDALGQLARAAGFRQVRFRTAHEMQKSGRTFSIFLMVAENR